MNNLSKLFLITAIAVFMLGTGAIALAQDTADTESATISAESLGVSNPTLLPDSPFYFLKEWGRGIQSFFAFGSLKKAELHQKFSSERLVELQKLVEEGKVGSEILEKATEKYETTLDKIEKWTDKIEGTTDSNEGVNKFLEKFTNQQMLHERILLRLRSRVSEQVMEKIEQAREHHMERFGEVMQKLETNQEKRTERIQNALRINAGNNNSDENEDEGNIESESDSGNSSGPNAGYGQGGSSGSGNKNK